MLHSGGGGLQNMWIERALMQVAEAKLSTSSCCRRSVSGTRQQASGIWSAKCRCAAVLYTLNLQMLPIIAAQQLWMPSRQTCLQAPQVTRFLHCGSCTGSPACNTPGMGAPREWPPVGRRHGVRQCAGVGGASPSLHNISCLRHGSGHRGHARVAPSGRCAVQQTCRQVRDCHSFARSSRSGCRRQKSALS